MSLSPTRLPPTSLPPTSLRADTTVIPLGTAPVAPLATPLATSSPTPGATAASADPSQEGQAGVPAALPAGSVLDEFSFLFSPARHAANNLAMVLLMNLESAVRALPEGERGGRQLRRALEAAEEYDALMRSVLGLTRESQEVRIEAATYLREMLPLLSLAAGRRLRLDADDAGVELAIRRPTIDAALLRLAVRMPGDAPAVVVLREERLVLGWEPPAAEAAALREAGATVAPGEGGWDVALPPG